eukprot:7600174-Karenia_brevis.AAC.1
MSLGIPTIAKIERPCFHFKSAKWAKLRAEYSGIDWAHRMNPNDANDAATTLTHTVLTTAKAHIDYSVDTVQRSTHPWLDER